MNDNLYAAIIFFIIGILMLFQRYKYPAKEGDFKFSLDFQSVLIGIGCIIFVIIALLKNFDIII